MTPRFAVGTRPRGFAALLALFVALLALPAVPVAAQELTRNQVFALQFYLNQLGHEAGRPDGKTGGRTRNALYRFAEATATNPAMTPAYLARIRAAARSVEGFAGEDGAIDFLVFTDAGTPLILTVEAVGQVENGTIPKPVPDETDSAEDADPQTPAEPAPATLAARQGSAFGMQVRVPTPPEGERLQIDQVVSEPRRLADGTVTFTEHVERRVVLTGSDRPQLWVWRFDEAPTAANAGIWRFSLENAGDIVVTRTFRVSG